MSDRSIRSIAIVGGGTAGWMAACLLSQTLRGTGCAITLVESPDIGTVGVGEATIPPIFDFLKLIEVDLDAFIPATQATFKLGIKFDDWRAIGDSYWHPFGTFGVSIDRRPFHHVFHKARAQGLDPTAPQFSLAAALGDAGRLAHPDPRVPGPLAGLRQALHFDAVLVARFLRDHAERRGVRRLEREVAEAKLRDDGFIEALALKGGGELAADLYIDCSGFRGLLIEQALGAGYEDWTRWLPCDRALAAPTAHAGPPPPYTQAVAMDAGWRWRIPLQHRVGNGYVYSSAFIDDGAAQDELLSAIGQPLAEPRKLSFTAGRRKTMWSRNCVALGLASGFLEPLESTSIHLVCSGLYKLLDHFPDRDFASVNIAAYNRALADEYETYRDFILLHYCVTARDDTAFWRDRTAAPLPDRLAERLELYRACGRVDAKPGELFTDLSWFYIFEGMGVTPRAYDPLVDASNFQQVRAVLPELTARIAAVVAQSPTHEAALAAIVRRSAA
ncbi:tryptophan halogenase family protein [Caulobacter rhizosphaerae]|jgi:tryptophan halogenase|uniref:tryptophan halogenase family protein n=1 Tax=Caulobacter rhizosphaerae TaxID=2010972 RepID=UPI0013D1B672|nr:tryptophan halogenase family protein [Caulobacter rhizosphaerae]GGL21483.1 tryptophan halogenase [Caulobacter rhizosphaerae]